MKFLSRALSWLDDIYSFEGNRTSTDELDLGVVTLVHDVERNAVARAGQSLERLNATGGKGAGAFITLREDYPTSAGFQVIQFDWNSWFATNWPSFNPNEWDLYLLEAFPFHVGSGPGATTNLGTFIRRSQRGLAGNNQGNPLLIHWFEDIYNPAGAATQDYGISRDGTIGPNIPLPMKLQLQYLGDPLQPYADNLGSDRIELFTNATTTATPQAGVQIEIYVTPRGMLPPFEFKW